MPKALKKTVKNTKIVKAAKPAKSARRVVKPWTKEDVRTLKAHSKDPHAGHQGIEGDEAHSWRSPAPSWYPRSRTRPPPVGFSVFRVTSAPFPYQRTCPRRPVVLPRMQRGCAD
jgi:hypothetical protein